MSSLDRLQQEFQRYVLDGSGTIEQEVVDTDKSPARVRMGVYADGYRVRLLGVLKTDYPGLRGLAGEEEFNRLAREYIEAHSSPYFNIRWYGDGLAAFLERTEPYGERPALAEMAAFEWAMTLAFDAPDVPAVPADHVACLPSADWPALVCSPHPALRRLDLEWNVPAIWKAIDAGQEPEPCRANSVRVPWIIWRRALKVYFRSLEADEAWALGALMAGRCFGDLCEDLCKWREETEVALHAAAMLKRWLTDGLIAGIDCS
jgi:putative DNA-binding protein